MRQLKGCWTVLQQIPDDVVTEVEQVPVVIPVIVED